MDDLLFALFMLSILALVVGMIRPSVVLPWLPEVKRNRLYVLIVFGGIALASLFGLGMPSFLENVFFILFLISILALLVAMIKPSLVLSWVPSSKRNRPYAVMIFGTVAILSLALGASTDSMTEESVDSSAQVEQQQKEVDTVKAEEEETKAKEEEKAKEEAKAKESEEKRLAEEQAKKEAEEQAKKEAEEKAKKEAEEKAKKEAEEKAKKEAEEKAKKEAKAKAEAEAKAKKEQEAAKNTPTISQSQAVRKAESYLSLTAFSKIGLIEQLEFEGFSTKDATYAVENIDVDWNEQAVKKAENYLSLTAFSRSGLIEQLVFEGFTNAQATHAANQVGL